MTTKIGYQAMTKTKAEKKQKKNRGPAELQGGSFGLPRFLGPDNGIQPRPMTRTKLSDILPTSRPTDSWPTCRVAARVCQHSLTVKSPKARGKAGATAVHQVKPGQAARRIHSGCTDWGYRRQWGIPGVLQSLLQLDY
ncbi:hypothetical protein J3E68DRAFT_197096 [Trichoderma sp. SZMC 28012]